MEFITNEQYQSALGLSLISGLATSVGGLFVICFGQPSHRMTGFMLGFASGVMLYVSLLDLLPESYHVIDNMFVLLVAFAVGCVIMHMIVQFIPEPDPSSFVTVPSPASVGVVGVGEDDGDVGGVTTSTSLKSTMMEYRTNNDDGDDDADDGDGDDNINGLRSEMMHRDLELCENHHDNRNDDVNSSHDYSDEHQHGVKTRSPPSSHNGNDPSVTTSKNNSNNNNGKNREHHHNHNKNNSHHHHHHTVVDTKLLVTGLIVVAGISIHNFPEGMAVFLSTMNGWRMGLTIAIAIGLHNFPEGMAVAAPIYAATNNKWTAMKWSILSGLCEPVGALAFGLVFHHFMSEYAVSIMLASVAGIMTYVCARELIPNALRYSGINTTLLANLIGGCVLFICSRLLSSIEE